MSDDETRSSGGTRDEPPEGEAEPRGGPGERSAAFLGERLTELRPRGERPYVLPRATLRPDEPPEEGEAPPPVAMAPASLAAAPPAVRPGYRRERIEQYRSAQRRKLRATSAPVAGPDPRPRAGAGPAPPPEAPSPPPANNWIPIGPSCLRQGQAGTRPITSGRTPGIAVAPGGDRVYVAAANGGVWRSEDAGDTWVSLMNAFDLNPTQAASDSLACGALALVAGGSVATDRLYVGSGEGHGGALFGVGPIVSTDGGANWATEPVSGGSPQLAGSGFYALAVDPGDGDRVVAATRLGVYRREPDGTGGFHWDRKGLPGLPAGVRVTSVTAAATGGSTTFFAAPRGGPVFSSTDGATWAEVGTGFPVANVDRVGLAVREGDPSVVYALVVRSDNSHLLGVWRLDVADGAWHQVTGVPATLFGPSLAGGGQGWYDLAIAVAPNDVDRVYVGGSTRSSGGEWSASLYRLDVTVASSSGSITGASATDTYIGGSVHADVHALVFAPGDANKLWVGCDGGVFYSTNPTGAGPELFEARNTGLQTLTMEHLGQHPTEDAVVFCGTQDNGGDRFTGEEAWLYSAGGDCGYFVVDWNDPYRVLNTYTYGSIRRSTDGGSRGSYTSQPVPLAADEAVLFYAPLVGTPPNPGAPAEAARVAFGSIRPWISDGFGAGWQSIPNDDRTDDLVGPIRSLVFASADKLYAGTTVGWVFVGGGVGWINFTDAGVYRFERSGGAWTRTRIDTGVGTDLPLEGPVTDVAVDPSDPTGDSIYVTFGGTGDYRHVWHFDGTDWTQRSGPSAGAATALLDVQHNAVATDPANPSHVYAGADIGIWRSTDGGANWQPYSEGLPDAAVMDLKLHGPRRLLRASTHGRGVWERSIDLAAVSGVELYVRSTQLDQGRLTVVNGLDDPTDPSATVRHWRGPDIKLDTPDALGDYQFPLTGTIDFAEFTDQLTDDYRNVATHATATITTRVYVQVHNRGVTPADGVRVMALLANASAGLPALPANYWTDVQTGTAINTPDWKTLGIVTLDGVRVGFPKIAAFDLPSSLLPPPAGLAGADHHCVLALVHHADDPYASTRTDTDENSKQERKAAHKNLKVVQFTGTVPSPPPAVVPIRIHNARANDPILTRVEIRPGAYRGALRLAVPELRFEAGEGEGLRGLSRDGDMELFGRWAEEHREAVRVNQCSEHPWNRDFADQRLADLEAVLEAGELLSWTGEGVAALGPIVMEPRSRHTLFLLLDRPPDAEVGGSFPIDVVQVDERTGEVIGGLDARVDLVDEPRPERYFLRLWKAAHVHSVSVRARLHDADGEQVTPEQGARVDVTLTSTDGRVERPGAMTWHPSWRLFYTTLSRRMFRWRWLRSRVSATAVARVGDRKVAEETLEVWE